MIDYQISSHTPRQIFAMMPLLFMPYRRRLICRYCHDGAPHDLRLLLPLDTLYATPLADTLYADCYATPLSLDTMPSITRHAAACHDAPHTPDTPPISLPCYAAMLSCLIDAMPLPPLISYFRRAMLMMPR